METKITKPVKAKDIKRTWHLVDVNGKVLGRAATEIAKKLSGKAKPEFARSLDCGDYVVVINAAKVAVTGKKEKEKTYTRYSGYPGGLKAKALWQLRSEKPVEIVRHAVWGMLPVNKLRKRLVTRLYIYAGDVHPYAAKLEAAAK